MSELRIRPVSNTDLNLSPVAHIISYLLAACTYGEEPPEYLGQRLFEPLLEPLSFLFSSFALSDVLSDAQDAHEGMIPAQIVRRDTEAPTAYRLSQNYPNPFNPETAIRYALPEDAHVELVIYNATGQVVRTLVDASRPARYHQVIWDSRDDQGRLVSGGVYFYRMTADEFSDTRRMILLR